MKGYAASRNNHGHIIFTKTVQPPSLAIEEPEKDKLRENN
jgi:hypothetical protein